MNSQKPESPWSRRGYFTTLSLATAFTMALAVTSSGCASWSPKTQELPEMALPAAWSIAASPTPFNSAIPGVVPATSLAQWWQKFNDPLLSTLVTNALQANTTVRSAQAALRQSRALRDVQAAGLLPGVSASGSA